jgi:hypothetical protein
MHQRRQISRKRAAPRWTSPETMTTDGGKKWQVNEGKNQPTIVIITYPLTFSLYTKQIPHKCSIHHQHRRHANNNSSKNYRIRQPQSCRSCSPSSAA